MLYCKKRNEKQKKRHGRKSPQGGWGAGLKEPTQKIFSLLLLVTISETSWSLYGIKPRSYNFAKFLDFSERGDPWGDLNAPEATFEQQLLLFSVTPTKKNQACYNKIWPKSL